MESVASHKLLDDRRRLSLVPMHFIPQKDGLILQGQRSTLRVSGNTVAVLVGKLFPLLDGSLDAQGIVDACSEQMGSDATLSALALLLNHKLISHLEAVPETLPEDALAHFESLRRHFTTSDECGWNSVRELQQARVVIAHDSALVAALLSDLVYMGIGNVVLVGDAEVKLRDIQQSTYLLAEDEGRSWVDVLAQRFPATRLGTKIEAIGRMPENDAAWEQVLEGATLAVATVSGSTYFHPWLKALNRAAMTAGAPWTVVGDVRGFGITVGPTMQPHVTACFHCFEVRVKANLRDIEGFSRVEQHVVNSGDDVDFGSFAPSNQIAAHICAQEVRDQILSNRLAQTFGNMLVVDLENYNISSHAVLKLPRCPACSNIEQKAKVRAWA